MAHARDVSLVLGSPAPFSDAASDGVHRIALSLSVSDVLRCAAGQWTTISPATFVLYIQFTTSTGISPGLSTRNSKS
jgi:hypothetical protein